MQAGSIWRDDLEIARGIVRLGFHTNPYYKCATIFGLRFTGRGRLHVETGKPKKKTRYGAECANYRPCNPLNNLKNHWKKPAEYSSFARVRLSKESFANSWGAEQIVQFNFFFRVNLPGDPVLHNIPMGNVIQRSSTKIHSLHHVGCGEWDSGVMKGITFVPLTNTIATPLLVAPFTNGILGPAEKGAERAKPIMLDSGSKRITSLNRKFYATADEKIGQIILIDLKPEFIKTHRYDKAYNERYKRTTDDATLLQGANREP
jgi:hypothetical protein